MTSKNSQIEKIFSRNTLREINGSDDTIRIRNASGAEITSFAS